MLTTEQNQELLKPIDASRVKRDGKGYSHVEAWDIRRTMNRIFGFGQWSSEVLVMELVSERLVEGREKKQRYEVIYRAQCRLTVGGWDQAGVYTEWAAGDGLNASLPDAHDMAVKTAESQALKRCAMNLGDQFGLSLYKDGSLEASVGEIVGGESLDESVVTQMLGDFDDAKTLDELQTLADVIPKLILTEQGVQKLRDGYKKAKARINTQ